MGGAFHPGKSLENFRLTESKTYSMMCARRGSQGVKTRDAQDAEKARCRLAVGPYFFADMIILSPSKEATTVLFSRLRPRACAHGLGIDNLKPTEPEPPLLAIRLSSRLLTLFILSLFPLRRRNKFYKKTSRSPFDTARRIEPAQLGYTSPMPFLPRAWRGAYEVYELHRFPRRL